MKPYQERVVVEKKELDEKILKLCAFVDSDTFKALSPLERSRMSQQFAHMVGYSAMLGARIEAFAQENLS